MEPLLEQVAAFWLCPLMMPPGYLHGLGSGIPVAEHTSQQAQPPTSPKGRWAPVWRPSAPPPGDGAPRLCTQGPAPSMASVGLFCAQHLLSDLLHFIVLVLQKSRRRPPGSGVWALLLEDTKRPSDMNWNLLALRSL